MNVIMLLKHKDSLKYIYEDNTLRQGLEKNACSQLHRYPCYNP